MEQRLLYLKILYVMHQMKASLQEFKKCSRSFTPSTLLADDSLVMQYGAVVSRSKELVNAGSFVRLLNCQVSL